MSDELAPVVDLRVVERVRQSTSKEGFNDLVVVSQRIQLRRAGSDQWESLDIVVENADDYQTTPLGRRSK